MSKEIYDLLVKQWMQSASLTEVGRELQTELTPVQSSNLAAVGYDPTNHWLEVAFLDGSIYRYYDVDETVYEELMNAPSHGGYFYWNIRESYDYDRIVG